MISNGDNCDIFKKNKYGDNMSDNGDASIASLMGQILPSGFIPETTVSTISTVSLPSPGEYKIEKEKVPLNYGELGTVQEKLAYLKSDDNVFDTAETQKELGDIRETIYKTIAGVEGFGWRKSEREYNAIAKLWDLEELSTKESQILYQEVLETGKPSDNYSVTEALDNLGFINRRIFDMFGDYTLLDYKALVNDVLSTRGYGVENAENELLDIIPYDCLSHIDGMNLTKMYNALPERNIHQSIVSVYQKYDMINGPGDVFPTQFETEVEVVEANEWPINIGAELVNA